MASPDPQNISVAPPSDQPPPTDTKGKTPNPNKGSNKGKKAGSAAPLGPLPAFIEERNKIWDEYKKKHEEELSSMY